MKKIEDYRQEHIELLEMVNEIKPMLNERQFSIRPLAKTAHNLLCEIVEKISDHINSEDKDLYPSLLVDENPKIKSIAWGFKSGEQSLRRGILAYQKKWLKDCDFEFTEEFVNETLEVFELLGKRVEQEERVLFPRVEKSNAAD